MTPPGDANGLAHLSALSALPSERIRYEASAEPASVQSIDCGVLFFVAFWSGPSVKAFRQLTNLLIQLDNTSRIELVVVDIDGSEELYRMIFNSFPRGVGETAWVQNGVILATSELEFNQATFERNTRILLNVS